MVRVFPVSCSPLSSLTVTTCGVFQSALVNRIVLGLALRPFPAGTFVVTVTGPDGSASREIL